MMTAVSRNDYWTCSNDLDRLEVGEGAMGMKRDGCFRDQIPVIN